MTTTPSKLEIPLAHYLLLFASVVVFRFSLDSVETNRWRRQTDPLGACDREMRTIRRNAAHATIYSETVLIGARCCIAFCSRSQKPRRDSLSPFLSHGRAFKSFDFSLSLAANRSTLVRAFKIEPLLRTRAPSLVENNKIEAERESFVSIIKSHSFSTLSHAPQRPPPPPSAQL